MNQVVERAFERFRVISVLRLEVTAFGSCIVLLFERVFESFECQVRLGLCLLVLLIEVIGTVKFAIKWIQEVLFLPRSQFSIRCQV
jgi:hypothetical protein